MSLIPVQAYANPNTPLWASAQGGTSSALTNLLENSGPITMAPVPLLPTPPASFAIDAYATTAGTTYDINALVQVAVDSGSSSGDYAQITLGTGGLGASWTFQQTCDTGNAYFAIRTRLTCVTDDIIKINLFVAPGMGSTATYEAYLVYMNVNEVS